jgi:hypothetical protein
VPHDVVEVPQHREDSVLRVRGRLIGGIATVVDLNSHRPSTLGKGKGRSDAGRALIRGKVAPA